jgi:hypothetical protein
VLPPRMQRIFYNRLKLYNCAGSQHPEQLQKYGGVAICSGGCYKSLNDWCYMEASLFKADFVSCAREHPLIFEVSGAPDCYLANGPYLRTTDIFNGYPVYAQLNQSEVLKLEKHIKNTGLRDHLVAAAQNLEDRNLRAGERLLVRQQNAWVLQSVTAYTGFSRRYGECGFHFLHFPDSIGTKTESECTCFAGMNINMTPIMERCGATLASRECDAHDFNDGSIFLFDFGSCRCVRPTVAKGTNYKPRQTQHQEFHSDGPTEHDATSIWTKCGRVNWKSDACRLSRLDTLTQTELEDCCRSRSLDANGTRHQLIHRLAAWLDNQPKTQLLALDSMVQSLSALFAFFPHTALGIPRSPKRSSSTWSSLKLSIPIGTALLFRFDFFHHGWKCVDENDSSALPVHFRAHFYLFSGFLPALPVDNFEAALEFLSVLSHDDMDDATLLLMLECLQTFVPYSNPLALRDYSLKPLEELAKCRKFTLFTSQQELDTHCKGVADRCPVVIANDRPAKRPAPGDCCSTSPSR